MKHRNDSLALPLSASSVTTNVGSHDCMRCTFCNMTHPPFCANFPIVRSALDSCPWPVHVTHKEYVGDNADNKT